MELLRKEEREKTKMTLEEIEKVKAERLALKAKRLEELKEERRQQQEEIAKKMKMSIDAANNMKMFDSYFANNCYRCDSCLLFLLINVALPKI